MSKISKPSKKFTIIVLPNYKYQNIVNFDADSLLHIKEMLI